VSFIVVDTDVAAAILREDEPATVSNLPAIETLFPSGPEESDDEGEEEE